MVAVVGAYQPGCRRVCVVLAVPACCGVLGISLPLAKTGVSGREQLVCIPEPAATLDVVPELAIPPLPQLPLPPEDEQGSAEGECLLVNGRRLDGPGKSVGNVLLSTGTC